MGECLDTTLYNLLLGVIHSPYEVAFRHRPSGIPIVLMSRRLGSDSTPLGGLRTR